MSTLQAQCASQRFTSIFRCPIGWWRSDTASVLPQRPFERLEATCRTVSPETTWKMISNAVECQCSEYASFTCPLRLPAKSPLSCTGLWALCWPIASTSRSTTSPAMLTWRAIAQAAQNRDPPAFVTRVSRRWSGSHSIPMEIWEQTTDPVDEYKVRISEWLLHSNRDVYMLPETDNDSHTPLLVHLTPSWMSNRQRRELRNPETIKASHDRRREAQRAKKRGDPAPEEETPGKGSARPAEPENPPSGKGKRPAEPAYPPKGKGKGKGKYPGPDEEPKGQGRWVYWPEKSKSQKGKKGDTEKGKSKKGSSKGSTEKGKSKGKHYSKGKGQK